MAACPGVDGLALAGRLEHVESAAERPRDVCAAAEAASQKVEEPRERRAVDAARHAAAAAAAAPAAAAPLAAPGLAPDRAAPAKGAPFQPALFPPPAAMPAAAASGEGGGGCSYCKEVERVPGAIDGRAVVRRPRGGPVTLCVGGRLAPAIHIIGCMKCGTSTA